MADDKTKEQQEQAIKDNSEFSEVYDITTLPPRRQRFVHLYITGMYKNIELAEIFGVSPGTINLWLRDPKVNQAVTSFQQDENDIVDKKLKTLRDDAVNAMASLLSSDVEQTRYMAAKDILDRTGHKASNKIDVKKEVHSYEHNLKELIDTTMDGEDIFEVMLMDENDKGEEVED